MSKSIAFRYLLISTALLVGCKANYAPIGYSSPMTFSRAKKKLSVDIKEIAALKPELEHKDLSLNPEIRPVKVFFPVLHFKDSQVDIPIFKLPLETKQILKQDPKQRLKEKRKKQRKKLWRKAGSNLVIGGVFLGIAIALALLHLGSLATLFGLASIVFLYFGLKKLFKKKKKPIQNPFRKKN